MNISESKVESQTEDTLHISYQGDRGYGNLALKYNHNGTYTLDAEYVSIETIVSIFKAIPKEQVKNKEQLCNRCNCGYPFKHSRCDCSCHD